MQFVLFDPAIRPAACCPQLLFVCGAGRRAVPPEP